MKVGTPSSAVITPTGSCCGATSVRAIVSVSSSSVPPASAQAGSSALVVASSSRRACGTTRPTKPIAPPVVTATAVASDASA